MTPDTFIKLFAKVCPYRIGSKVRVSPDHKLAADWPETFVVVGVRWNYQSGDGHEIEIDIATDDEIIRRHGPTGPWRVEDLVPATPALLAKDQA